MSSHDKILKELKEIREKINKLKVTQEVKVENILNLEDLNLGEVFDLSGIELSLQGISSKLDELGLNIAEVSLIQGANTIPTEDTDTSKITLGDPDKLVDVESSVVEQPREYPEIALEAEEQEPPQSPNICDLIEEVNQQIQKLSEQVDSVLLGLAEVKSDLNEKYSQIIRYYTLTTGPIIRSSRVKNLCVKILNNSAAVHKVRVTLFNLQQNPKRNVAYRLVTIAPGCSELETFIISSTDLDLEEFEVVLEFLNGDTQNISTLVFGTKGKTFQVTPENVYYHRDLLPMIYP